MLSDEQRALFVYDADLPFDVQENNVETRDSAIIKDIRFVATADKSVNAYLVMPESGETKAGILWIHWLGEEKCNREEFLEDAVELAQAGVVSLLPDTMWSEEGWYDKRVLSDDLAIGIQQVIEICRAMDLLCSQEGVDRDNIAFVGHDYGAMYGTLASGIQTIAKAYCWIALTPSFLDWAFFRQQPESRVDYIKQNAVLEPFPYLQEITSASMLFQYAEKDIYIGYTKRMEWVHHAPEPKEMKVYADADHSMTVPQVRVDRIAWLKSQLGLKD